MKKLIPVAIAAALFGFGAVTVHAEQAMQTTADSVSVFATMQPDATGAVSAKIMHAPAGDVEALYVGRLPKQVYAKQDDLLYIVSGYGTASVGYPVFDIKPGTLVSIPRNTSFDITATGKGPIKAILIASPHDDPADKRTF